MCQSANAKSENSNCRACYTKASVRDQLHDLNSALAIAMGFVDLANRKEFYDPKRMEKVFEALKRIEDITSELGKYSRP